MKNSAARLLMLAGCLLMLVPSGLAQQKGIIPSFISQIQRPSHKQELLPQKPGLPVRMPDLQQDVLQKGLALGNLPKTKALRPPSTLERSAGLLSQTPSVATQTSGSGNVAQEWATRFESPTPGRGGATDIAVDGSGNVYVTGWSQNSDGNDDYATIKYSSNGTQLWAARYNSPNNLEDTPLSLAVDGAGNVYVTGYSVVDEGTRYSDYLTIKYSTSGTQLWVAHYNGPANLNDYAMDLALDGSGNVYVAGSSDNSTNSDYATIKYSTSGAQLWIARYNGPANNYDGAQALAVDRLGNVYVTGTSISSAGDYDYATVKYSSSGTEQWSAPYNGPANHYDSGQELAVDGAGNVYVTGFTVTTDNDWDYATVKYSISGQEQWSAIYKGLANGYDQVHDLAVDGSGDVYVTGSSQGSDGNNDYATVKYSTNGVEAWVARYNSAAGFFDNAQALALDGLGNVYVTGVAQGSGNSDYTTIKYSANSGAQLWLARYEPLNSSDAAQAVVVDGSGNVYVTGNSYYGYNNSDFATVKYSPNGQEQWSARYNAPKPGKSQAMDLAVDEAGNTYVTGSSIGREGTDDYATIKYSPSGAQLWVARYNGAANATDFAYSIAVDRAGNVYVTGFSDVSTGGRSYVTIKYSPSGVQLWVAQYQGPAHYYDLAQKLVVDGAGNVYVTGTSYGSDIGNSDYATIKYSASGVELWVARYNGPGNSSDDVRDLAVDGQGNVYVTGNSYNDNNYTNNDYATVKYSPSGAQLWVARYNGPGNLRDAAFSLAVDGQGNVYVAGSSDNSTNSDYATIKYSTSGAQLWIARYNGPANNYDGAQALAVDRLGNVYVTGTSISSAGDYDYATLKYSASGDELWAARYNSIANGFEVAQDLAVDDLGNVYVTGSSYSSTFTDSDYATVKYSATGTEEWEARYNGPANSKDEARAVAVDGSGNVYVTGRSYTKYSDNYYDESYSNYATIKYSQTAPTLTSLSPTRGPVGTSVILAGTSFTAATSVSFNGTNAPGFVINSATQLTVPVPAGATTGPVVVTRGSLSSDGVLFTVTHAPVATTQRVGTDEDVATTITLAGTDADGDALTYTVVAQPAHGTLSQAGTNWMYTPSLNYNGLDSFTFTASDGSLTSVPATVSITVTPVNDPPVLTNVPQTVSIPKNLPYTFTATATDVEGNPLTFSLVTPPAGAAITAAGVFTWTPTAQQVRSTPYLFSVKVSDGVLAATQGVALTVLQSGTVFSFAGFSPTSGPIGTGVTVTGTGMGTVSAVKFNGLPASFTRSSSAKIVATVPGGAISGPITLVSSSGAFTSTVAFTVTPAAPTLSAFTPPSGPVGTVVTLRGTNLLQTTSVRFSGLTAPYTVQNDWEVLATVPAGSATGKVSLTTPGGSVQSATNFVVVPAPSVTGFTPALGPVGTAVTISGYGFASASSVTFNGIAAVIDQTKSTATSLVVAVPAGAKSGKIAVTTPGGTAVSKDQFLVTASVARAVMAAAQPASAAEPGLPLQASPNPFAERVQLRFALAQEQPFTVRVYDARGGLVQELAAGTARRDEILQFDWNGRRLAEGLYLVRLSTASLTQTVRVILQH